MKIKLIRYYVQILILGMALAACSLAIPQDTAESFNTGQVWFDAPLPGSVFPLGDIQIVAHAADETGLGEMELSLMDGVVIGNQTAGQGDTLATAAFNWHPPEPGHYVLQFRAANVNGDWGHYAYTEVDISGEEPLVEESIPAVETPQPTDTPETCTDLASFISETIQDDTVFKPGVGFTKTWTLQNAGTCTWTQRLYALSFYDGEQMGGPSMIPLSTDVLPGERITLAVNLTAPTQNGNYKGRWMLMNADGTLFGLGEGGKVAFWVQIIVQPEDAKAPTVEAAYSPKGRGEPHARQQITFSANAADNVKVTRIEIYLEKPDESWQLIATCKNQDDCSVQLGPYAVGAYKLQAFAYDAVGNEGSSEIVNFNVILP